ncbi:MAG: ATP-grasp domain-containing protein [Prevotellaceae bacterium]|nr:ATP-grasp domain-containing protein [Prevotellaceae bacterium]
MRSGAGIASQLDKQRYTPFLVEIHQGKWEALLPDGTRAKVDRNDFSFEAEGARVRPDFCYVTIHGTPGENGILQGYLDLIGMPYSTSDVLVEALTFHKFALNNYMRSLGVSVADSLLVRAGKADEVNDTDILERIGLPCFVKPTSGGSSFGTTKVKTAEALRPAIEAATREGGDVMVEAFMQGTEITCGCYKTRKAAHVFPITEVVTSNEFFDYDAKYNGQVSEITPARLSAQLTERVQRLTSLIYDILGCHGIIRIDYIITEGVRSEATKPFPGEGFGMGTDDVLVDLERSEKINLLEINTTPGMTATSFIPQQIRAAGLSVTEVLTDIIEDTLNN